MAGLTGGVEPVIIKPLVATAGGVSLQGASRGCWASVTDTSVATAAKAAVETGCTDDGL